MGDLTDFCRRQGEGGSDMLSPLHDECVLEPHRDSTSSHRLRGVHAPISDIVTMHRVGE
jgi:hypothetical protein